MVFVGIRKGSRENDMCLILKRTNLFDIFKLP